MSLTLTHIHNDRLKLAYSNAPLFEYVYKPQLDPFDFARPYFCPMYTLAGDDITIFRPHDHRWHNGLSMTWTYINDQNFWGGNTYVHGEGYMPFDNVGATHHIEWLSVECGENHASFRHRLEWVTSSGETWLQEERHIASSTERSRDGIWSLDFTMRFDNVSGQTLNIDSPTTKGRPKAGYGGLFWRGPRSFRNGNFVSSGGQTGVDILDKQNAWVAYTGKHDGNENASTLIFVDDPANPRYPTKWWGREDPYACVSSSFVYDEPFVFETNQQLSLKYRVFVCNGAYDFDAVGKVVS